MARSPSVPATLPGVWPGGDQPVGAAAPPGWATEAAAAARPRPMPAASAAAGSSLVTAISLRLSLGNPMMPVHVIELGMSSG